MVRDAEYCRLVIIDAGFFCIGFTRRSSRRVTFHLKAFVAEIFIDISTRHAADIRADTI